MGRRADASLAGEMRPFGGAGVEISAAGAFDSFNRQNSRFLWRRAVRVMLDKVDGDMVHLRLISGRQRKRRRRDNNSSAFTD
jgi:hypothetical protein